MPRCEERSTWLVTKTACRETVGDRAVGVDAVHLDVRASVEEEGLAVDRWLDRLLVPYDEQISHRVSWRWPGTPSLAVLVGLTVDTAATAHVLCSLL